MGNSGNSDRLYFLGFQNHCRWWLQPWNVKTLAPWRKSYDKPAAAAAAAAAKSLQSCPTVRPSRRQPTGLLCPWDSPGKNTGAGCHLDSLLKSRDITLPTKVHLVKAMLFPVVIYGCESWTIKKAERRRIDAFQLWCWRRPLRVPWTARRSNQPILKEISLVS